MSDANSKCYLRLVGQFNVPLKISDTYRFDRRIVLSEKELADYRRYYTPEIVDLTFLQSYNYDLFKGDSPMKGSVPVSKKIDGELVTWHVVTTLTGIKARLMPFGVMLFWIEMELDLANLNDYTIFVTMMRDPVYLDRLSANELVNVAFAPLKQLYAECTGVAGPRIADLCELGNKFKVFQVVEADEEARQGINPNILINQLATFSTINAPDTTNLNSMSERYLLEAEHSNLIWIYNDWRGMALYDTFTILRLGATDFRTKYVWLDDYFGVIYLYNLYRKFYLQSLSRRFRSYVPLKGLKAFFTAGPDSPVKLADEFDDFNNRCCFHNIAYNFLPLEIDNAIYNSLGISKETEQLDRAIHNVTRQQEEKSARRTNNLLTFLTIITIVSTLCDAVSLMGYNLVGGAGSTVTFNRLFTLILLFTILIVIAFILKPKRESKR